VSREWPATDWVHVHAVDGDNMFKLELVVKEPHKGCTSTMEANVTREGVVATRAGRVGKRD
jgi:hypothetical protein